MAAPTSAGRKPDSHTFAQQISGDTTLASNCNAVYVGGAGTVTVYMEGDGVAIAFTATAGVTLPVRGSRIVPGSATAVVALW